MKRVGKFILAILLILVCVGGTSFLFFKNFKKDDTDTNLLLGFISGTETIAFQEKLTLFKITANVEKLEILISTQNDLIGFAEMLTADEAKVKENVNLTKQNKIVENLKNSRENCLNKIDEYLIKSQYVQFNKVTGANSAFKSLSSYVCEYANFIKGLNEGIADASLRKSDLKFDLIELYCDVAKSCFGNLREVNGEWVLNSTENLSLLKTNYVQNNFVLSLQSNKEFSKTASDFSVAFAKCNKAEFANALKSYLETVSLGENSTYMQQAGFYLAKLFEGEV